MNMSNKTNWISGMLALILLLGGYAQADYVMHGRVSYDAGNTLVKGAQEVDWSNASINTLILSGDNLWVDSGGTAEVEFPGGNFLRMADASKVEVNGVSPTLALRGWTGSFYVQRISRSTGDVVLETPAAMVRVSKDTAIRIDILEDGATAITVRWGAGTVRTQNGHELTLTSGQRVWVEPGLLPSDTVRFSSNNDDSFDRWNRDRAEWLATGQTKTPIPVSDSTIGMSDLSNYGEWVVIDNRSYWRPTVVVDYVPYRYGRWSYTSGIGNVWVGTYPFSYTTTHYGFWDYYPRYGWVWSYHDVWSPAWVATVRYGDHFLWSPINRYHRPVLVSESAYFSIGGVRFSYHASSYVPANYLYWGPSRISPVYGSPFQTIYNSGNINITNIYIWNINTSGRNHVRVPYEHDFSRTSRNYNPSRTIRGTVSSPYDGGRSAHDRVRALETRIDRDSFNIRGREETRNVRTAMDRNESVRNRTVQLTQETPSYLRDVRGRTVSAEEVRASIRDREAVPRTSAATGEVQRRTERTAPDQATGIRGTEASDRTVRTPRTPDATQNRSATTVRGEADRSTPRSNITERSGTERGTETRVLPDTASRQRNVTTARPDTAATPRTHTRTVPESRTTERTETPRGTVSRGSAERSEVRPRVTVGDTVDRSRTAVQNPTVRPGTTTNRSSTVRPMDDRSRTVQTTPRAPAAESSPNRSQTQQTPNRSVTTVTPRSTETSGRTQDRVQPQSMPNRSQTQIQTPDRSSNRQVSPVQTAPVTPRSQAPSATVQPRATTPSVRAPQAQQAPQAPTTTPGVRAPATPRSTTIPNVRSAEPRGNVTERPGITNRAPSSPRSSSGISSGTTRQAPSVSAPAARSGGNVRGTTANATPRSSAGSVRTGR